LYFTLYFHRKSHATYKPSELVFMENMKREVGTHSFIHSLTTYLLSPVSCLYPYLLIFVGISNIFVTVCLCLASILGGVIINASFVTLLCCGVWAVAISQLYQVDSSSGSITNILTLVVLACNAAASAAVVGMSFTWYCPNRPHNLPIYSLTFTQGIP